MVNFIFKRFLSFKILDFLQKVIVPFEYLTVYRITCMYNDFSKIAL